MLYKDFYCEFDSEKILLHFQLQLKLAIIENNALKVLDKVFLQPMNARFVRILMACVECWIYS